MFFEALRVFFLEFFEALREFFLEFLRDARRPPIFWLSVLNNGVLGSTPPGHDVYVLYRDRGAGCEGDRMSVFILSRLEIL